MICKRCQRSLRSGEGLKCGICESCFHMRCVTDYSKEHRDCGDLSPLGYQWKCSLCQNYVTNIHGSSSESSTRKDRANAALLLAVSAISEKFELVNKIQLPKINSDIAQIKFVVDRIAHQNENILRKLDEIEAKKKKDKQVVSSNNRYRRRNVNFIPKHVTISENVDEVPVTATEKTVRYRTRRRSYLLNRIFRILNRKMNKTSAGKK